MMEHKGYMAGKIDVDPENGVLSGTVAGLHDVVHFKGRTAEELVTAFRESVDDYTARSGRSRNWGEFKFNLLTQCRGRTSQGCQRQACIGVVEQAIERSPAGAHFLRHRRFGQALSRHGLFDLPGDDALNSHSGHLFEHGVFGEKIVEAATNVRVVHFVLRNCFNLAFARSRSGFGVFWVFLMKA